MPRWAGMWVTPSAAGAGCVRLRVVLGLLLAGACVPRAHAQQTPSTVSEYSARGRVQEPSREGDALSEPETSALERSLGPSFALTEALPGVVPVFSGVPYLIVRGAAPSGSSIYYDGVPVPALFHVALGPSLILPELAGETRFFGGAASARYGPHVGGVIDRAGPSQAALSGRTRFLELTALDAAGLLTTPLGKGTLAVGWRYGNPGLMLRALGLDATLRYFNYQLRYHTPLSSRTQLTVLLFGAGDHLGERTVPSDDIDLSFHRLLVRLTTRVAGWTLGSELILASDASVLGEELSGDALRATERLYAQWSGSSLRLRTGAELSSALVHMARGNPSPTESLVQPGLSQRRDLVLDPEDFLDGQPFASVPNRSLLGAYAELSWKPVPALRLELGLRGDAFVSSAHLDGALSPVARVRVLPTSWLELHGAFALVHKPRTSPLPIPGLNDIALDEGVESALQSELGTSLNLGGYAQLEANLFYHRYWDTVYLELILDCQGNTRPIPPPTALLPAGPQASICRGAGLPTASGEAHGVELFLKRDLTQQLSGFVSYTLAHASATARDGTSFTPQSDVRHVLNAVLRYDFGHGLSLAARLQFRTGKMAVNTVFSVPRRRLFRLEYRLPEFLRLDVRLAYAFRVSFGRVEIALGLQNATFSREATNRDCRQAPANNPVLYPNGVVCEVDYQPFIALPNLGVRADF